MIWIRLRLSVYEQLETMDGGQYDWAQLSVGSGRRVMNMNWSQQRRLACRSQSGFTLIELLMALAIISLMAGIAVFAVGRARENATRNACLSERGAFQVASDAAELDSGDIRSYLQPSGRFFEASGTTGFAPRATSPLDADCD